MPSTRDASAGAVSVRARVLAVILASAAMAVSGCDENRKGDTSTEAPDRHVPAGERAPVMESVDPLTPIGTIRRVRHLRSAGRYSALEQHLPPDQRGLVVGQLRAGDRLLAAASLLRRTVEARFGLAAAQEFDYREVANVLGVFSADVTLVSESVAGDRAAVTFQVADRVPLKTVTLVRSQSRWLLVTDPIEGVPDQLNRLAGLLERLADDVERGRLTASELHTQLALRQQPILRRLKNLVERAPSQPGER